MKKAFPVFILFLIFVSSALAQNAKPTPTPAPRPQVQPTQQVVFDLSQYGVAIQPDARLIVMMAALEIAGFDPTPGKEPSEFRKQIRRDFADLNDDLRQRMRDFFARNDKALAESKLTDLKRNPDFAAQTKGLTEEQIKVKFKPTPAEQAQRYVSLAYGLTSAPELLSPERTDDLPGGLLEVLDFAPIVREFYRRSNFDEKLTNYKNAYQTTADAKLRRNVAQMVFDLTSYLNTKPELIYVQKIKTRTQEGKKGRKQLEKVETRDRERHFYIVPDLLAVPDTINFRNIGDDYFAIVPESVNPQSSELRRAYLQFILDPLILKNGKEISVHRDDIKQLLAERQKAGLDLPPDVYLAVARSLVAAADARQIEFSKVQTATQQARARIDSTKNIEDKKAISAELQRQKNLFADDTAASLTDAYQRGAVLSFYFADQLRGLESSGFDLSSSFADMIASLDISKEKNRLAENAEAVKRANAERENRKKAAADANAKFAPDSPEAIREANLTKKLKDIETTIKLQKFDEAEKNLLALLQEYPGNAFIFYNLGRNASLSAQNVFDEAARDARLQKAYVNYTNAIEKALPESDKFLLSQAYVARAKILTFYNRTEAALKDYNAAIALGEVPNGAYREALAGQQQLAQKP